MSFGKGIGLLLSPVNRQNILTAVFIVALLLAGYFWYTYSQSQPVISEKSGVLGVEVRNLGDYAKVENLALDLTLFSDPLFRALVPLPVPPSATTTPGRPNPFVPF